LLDWNLHIWTDEEKKIWEEIGKNREEKMDGKKPEVGCGVHVDDEILLARLKSPH